MFDSNLQSNYFEACLSTVILMMFLVARLFF